VLDHRCIFWMDRWLDDLGWDGMDWDEVPGPVWDLHGQLKILETCSSWRHGRMCTHLTTFRRQLSCKIQ
jgi:hypothetical protein